MLSDCYRFNTQNKDLRFGSFVFGPVIMRLLHHYNLWETALLVLRDEVCFESKRWTLLEKFQLLSSYTRTIKDFSNS